MSAYIRWFEDVDSGDVATVGGKNASLGEMIRNLKSKGIRVPEGFAVTAQAYRAFLDAHGLTDKIARRLTGWSGDTESLRRTGADIRDTILREEFPKELNEAIVDAYRKLSGRYGLNEADVAVRSSATAEDLPDASFAGQQDTFLNITGEAELLTAVRRCFASLFTDRAISYRTEKGFDHSEVSISVGVQKMVRSDVASAGVMFTIDTETGFPHIVMIDGSWGLGESVVAGKVTPDSFRVFKPLLKGDFRPIIDKTLGDKLTKIVYARGQAAPVAEVETTEEERRRFVLEDDEVLELARWARVIEEHYGGAMDIEWAKDGRTGELFIVQARPETVRSRETGHRLKSYKLTGTGKRLCEGLAIGNAIATGKTFVLRNIEEADRFEDGGILVTRMTDPDWVPIMKRAAAIVTDRGGRTSHAAIVSRELGVAAVIGTEDAMSVLKNGQVVTVSCAEGEAGYVYEGELEHEVTELDPTDAPFTRTKIMMNLASPGAALQWWNLPTDGVGLARMEFIISNIIKIHPLSLCRFEDVADPEVRETIEELTVGYPDKSDYFVKNLARGIAKIAAPHYPEPVIVRLSDFKTNEYADLIGGRQWEPKEENPMLGFRGAARYESERYRDGFELECRALKYVRQAIGLDNVVIMVPFCRTPEEGAGVLDVMARHGLVRGENGLRVYCMAEIPSNVVMAEEFADLFDGFSIGSNDLTQLVLGVDRDSEALANLFDERHEAVKRVIRDLIERAHKVGKPVGICGQAPSDHEDFAEFLVDCGIDSMSVNPDCVIDVRKRVAALEGARSASRA